MFKRLREFSWGYILIGILTVLVGVAFISFSESLSILARVIGITLAVFGIIFGTLAFVDKKRSLAFGFKIAMAVIFLACGITTAVLAEDAMRIIADVFCLLLIVDGAFKLWEAIISKRYSLFGWWFMLALSVIVIVSSFIVTKNMTERRDIENETLTIIMGVIILVDGVANFFNAFYHSGYTRKQRLEYSATATPEVSAPTEVPPLSEEARHPAQEPRESEPVTFTPPTRNEEIEVPTITRSKDSGETDEIDVPAITRHNTQRDRGPTTTGTKGRSVTDPMAAEITTNADDNYTV